MGLFSSPSSRAADDSYPWSFLIPFFKTRNTTIVQWIKDFFFFFFLTRGAFLSRRGVGPSVLLSGDARRPVTSYLLYCWKNSGCCDSQYITAYWPFLLTRYSATGSMTGDFWDILANGARNCLCPGWMPRFGWRGHSVGNCRILQIKDSLALQAMVHSLRQRKG